MTKLTAAAVAITISALSYMAGSAGGRTGAHFQYLESSVTVPANHDISKSFNCSNGYSAISGYWRSRAVAVVSDYNTVDTHDHSKWMVGAYNPNSSSKKVTLGVVCAHP